VTAPLVLDASAVVEYLRWSDVGARVAELIDDPGATLHIPHLCPIEVTSALRGLVLARKLDPRRAEAALQDLADLPATRYPSEPLLPRVWSLRSNFTAYDGTYLALAEALDATLVTADRKQAPRYRRIVATKVIR
jgi:predicted nucleic acid-binding protein